MFNTVFTFLETAVLVAVLFISSIYDIKYMKVRDDIILSVIILKIIFIFFSDDILICFVHSFGRSLIITIPLIIVVLIGEKIYDRQVMGGADIKLIFMCGLYLDMDSMLYSLLMAFILALPVGLYNYIKKRNKAYSFVPFLAVSVFMVLLPSAV